MTRFINRRLGVLALALALIGTGVGSLAVLTDTLTVTSDFSVLAIDLQANGQQSLSFTEQLNGEIVAQPLVVSNPGNGELRYSLAATATGSIVTKMKSYAWSNSSPALCTPTGSWGTNIASGNLATTAFGDSAAGQDDGDRVLAAGASETLCLTWRGETVAPNIPGPSDTGQQILTFTAESTANNP